MCKDRIILRDFGRSGLDGCDKGKSSQLVAAYWDGSRDLVSEKGVFSGCCIGIVFDIFIISSADDRSRGRKADGMDCWISGHGGRDRSDFCRNDHRGVVVVVPVMA